MLEALEEADNRMVCHVKDMIDSGICLSIQNICQDFDSDVVVILLSFMSIFLEINCNVELSVDHNTAANQRSISLNTRYQLLLRPEHM